MVGGAHMALFRVLLIGTVTLLYGLTNTLVVANQQGTEELQRAVENSLREERSFRRLDVSVVGTEVTLTGELKTFWEKNGALQRAFEVPGVKTVASEIVVPRVEDDQELANEVGEAIQRYSYYTMWDQIDGRVINGAVSITGAVTPERDKIGELFERIAKVRGVQDVQMNVHVMSASSQDRRIRSSIARRLFSSDHFERFRTMNNPPFHIIVNNSIVTLIGYVQSQIERIEMQQIVANTQGVLRVENKLQALR